MTKKFSPLLLILALLVFSLAFSSSSVRANQMGDWEYILISPLSGHWNYPGYFVLEATRSVTVSWEIKCTYGGCDRPDEEVLNYTFAEGEILLVGWGHQCYAWQFDPIGRTGFIAEAEPELCLEESPTPTQTAPPVTSTPTPGTPTATVVTPPVTPTSTPEANQTPSPSPTVVPETPTATPEPPEVPPQVQITQAPLLPAAGELPPASPLASPLWPALAALLLLGLAGRLVWTGLLQAENTQIPADLVPGLRAQATKILILILLSLLILALLILPGILRQAALDFGDGNSALPQAPALVQELPPNFISAQQERAPQEPAPVEPAPALQIQAQADPLARPPGPGNRPAPASFAVTPLDTWVDDSPVTRLVIPALNVDSPVRPVPFEDLTWDLEGLGMQIAWLGGTSSPGLGGNTVLAGHITALYLGNGPFRYLYYLKPGDLVQVHTLWKIYTYSVREQTVVKASDLAILAPTDRSQLTLLTCTGWDEDSLQYTKRRAVFADLVSEAPVSAGQIEIGADLE